MWVMSRSFKSCYMWSLRRGEVAHSKDKFFRSFSPIKRPKWKAVLCFIYRAECYVCVVLINKNNVLWKLQMHYVLHESNCGKFDPKSVLNLLFSLFFIFFYQNSAINMLLLSERSILFRYCSQLVRWLSGLVLLPQSKKVLGLFN